MKSLLSLLSRRIGEKGQGVVEYAIVLAVVTVIAVGISSSDLEPKVTETYNSVAALFPGGE